MLTSTPEAPAVATSTARQAAAAKSPLWSKRLSDIFWINNVAISPDGTHVVAGTFIHDYKNKSAAKGFPNVQGRFVLHVYENANNPPDPKKVEPKWIDEVDAWDGIFGVAISGNKSVVAASGWLERTTHGARGLLRAYDINPNADGTPKEILDYKEAPARFSWVVLSEDGNTLATVADDVYVFIKGADGTFNSVPLKLGVSETANRYCTNIALHPTDNWLVACDSSNHLYAARIENGRLSEPVIWTSPAPKSVPFNAIAIAANAGTFIAGGGNFVYLLNFDALMREGKNYKAIECNMTDREPAGSVPEDKPDGRMQENLRWVATSADGNIMTAGANRKTDKNPFAGVLFGFGPGLSEKWRTRLDRNPNATSIDAAGTRITLCEGYPTFTPGAFSLFDTDGNRLWQSDNHTMNWPMFISADGSAIAAGGDDGTVYFFAP
jgi:WD40 repeat protein